MPVSCEGWGPGSLQTLHSYLPQLPSLFYRNSPSQSLSNMLSVCSDAGVLRVVGPRQLAGVPCVYGGGSNFGGSLGIGGSKLQNKGKVTATASLRDSVQVRHCCVGGDRSGSVHGLGVFAPQHAGEALLRGGGQVGREYSDDLRRLCTISI